MYTGFEATQDTFTQDWVNGLPGVVLAVTNKDGIVYSRAAGREKQDAEPPISLDSTFWAFSCTKLLTTICALQCVERRLIRLDDEVGGVLPELAECSIISPKPDGSFSLAPAKNKITLRHLLTHTSGLSYDAMHPVLMAWRRSRGEMALVMSGRLNEAYSLPLLFEPGTSWVYGCGIDWAGVLVERLSGNMRLADYMAENLFKPLGMKSSTFHLSERLDVQQRLSQMWARTESGILKPIPGPYPADARDDSGGMGLVTSTVDFMEVLRDLLRDSPLLLEEKTVSEMLTAQFDVGSPQYEGLVSQEALHKQLTGDASGAPAVAFGLGGLVVMEDVPNLPSGTLTWNGMPNIGWFVNRDRDLAAIYMSQVLPASDPQSVKLLGDFWRDVLRPT
ncbi:Beta-lactamase family protein [Pleurostoma richardsiae]|uniref:Beta-lactamase family protein n=1 Tax=Pleurostoma richardsiae TaxID=41990 RepID=A0AA38RC95_9PEZI|nr:Beta-lactamase family protein [Pleurostoma richardsiae]